MDNVRVDKICSVMNTSKKKSIKKSIIFSTSQTSNSVIDVLRFNNELKLFNFIGILDDNPDSLNKYFFGLPVIGKFSEIKLLKEKVGINSFSIGLAAIKHMQIKSHLFKYCLSIGLIPINAIHKMVYISPSSLIGCGQLILPFTSISPDCAIGNNCSLHTNVSILEKCTIGNNVIVAGNSFIGAYCELGDNVYIGPGSVIGSNVSIGANTIVGAGSTVLKDLPETSFCYGNPISSIKKNNIYMEPKTWMK